MSGWLFKSVLGVLSVSIHQSRLLTCPIQATNRADVRVELTPRLVFLTTPPRVVGAPTDSELLHEPPELGFLLQEPQQVGGLHALQLHLPVDVDFVVEADVHQTGAVPSLLTRILTCTSNISIRQHGGVWLFLPSML